MRRNLMRCNLMRCKLSLLAVVLAYCPSMLAQQTAQSSATVVFWENGFPAADTAAPSRDAFALPGASFASAAQLDEALVRAQTRLLVLPYGSAFPETAWPAMLRFLERGGNLLVVGGRPFTRAAYAEQCQASTGCVWKLRPYRNSYSKRLLIADYAETPGSRNLQFEPNQELAGAKLPPFAWNRAWSPTVRLSVEDLYRRDGSAGSIDVRLDTLAWGAKEGHRMAAPVIQLDHLQKAFVGGRWILLPAELAADAFATTQGHQLLAALQQRALAGAEEFAVRPHWALFLPGEKPSLTVRWWHPRLAQAAHVDLTVGLEGDKQPQHVSVELPAGPSPQIAEVELPAPATKGLFVVTARLQVGGAARSLYRTGFWIRDEQFLRSGSKITLDRDFFRRDGHTYPVVGTTYMASDVQRQYLAQPNVYVWDRDLAQIQAAGMNMLRTGLWSGWEDLSAASGNVREETLRNLEAWLMTARKHNLPVQFTLFAFIPEVLGGENPYLDPAAVRAQSEFLQALATRFQAVPWLMWDLINEPSFDNPQRLWATRPHHDRYESSEWKRWLAQRYPDSGALAAAWNSTIDDAGGTPLPVEEDFAARGIARDAHPFAAGDFYMFAQSAFAAWATTMRDAIRSTGSTQLITVGQDEGGGQDRPNPAFYVPAVDFTTQHSWWKDDALLWDSLVAKQPGKPMLVQETGLQNNLALDGQWRLTPDEQAAVLERKLAVAVATGAGAIEWLWNVNAYMTSGGELPIGIVRPDGTEKPDAAVMRGIARFAADAAPGLGSPQAAQVAIVSSQTLQYSPLNGLAIAAQTQAVRVLHYDCRVPGYFIAENQLQNLGSPKLVILPAPQALPESTWQRLLDYVKQGGTMLVTGSMERDQNWVATQRLKALGVDASLTPITFHEAQMRIGEATASVSFSQQNWLDGLRFADDATVKQLTLGSGKLIVAAYPVELADDGGAAAALYAYALQQAGAESPFIAKGISPGVLVYPVVFQDSVLYLLASESASAENISVHDKLTGADIKFTLPAQRARLILLDRAGHVRARYPE